MTSGGVTFKWPNFDDIERIPRDDGGIDIVLDGEIIDTIEPLKRLPTLEENQAFLRRHHELAERISAQWNDTSMSAVDAVQEQRRNLTPDEWVDVDWRGEE